jgi:hypothetical protein
MAVSATPQFTPAEGVMTSFLQQLLDPFDSSFPALLLFAIEVFEGVDRGFGNILRLQVLRQDGYVVLEPLEVVAFDGTDALEHFAGVKGGLSVGERVRGSGWKLRSTKVMLSVRTRNRSRLVPGTCRSTSSPP